jgi:hypothetical protein
MTQHGYIPTTHAQHTCTSPNPKKQTLFCMKKRADGKFETVLRNIEKRTSKSIISIPHGWPPSFQACVKCAAEGGGVPHLLILADELVYCLVTVCSVFELEGPQGVVVVVGRGGGASYLTHDQGQNTGLFTFGRRPRRRENKSNYPLEFESSPSEHCEDSGSIQKEAPHPAQ